jgi:hypothetical protein
LEAREALEAAVLVEMAGTSLFQQMIYSAAVAAAAAA